MTRAANPDNEDYLLMIARHGSAWHMETLIAKYRRASRNMEAAMAAEHGLEFASSRRRRLRSTSKV